MQHPFVIIRAIALFALSLLCHQRAQSCSAYKVSAEGQTLLGVNFDTWTPNPRIWFESTGYGAAFVGANYDADGLRPQSGMNVYGLAFGTLAAPTPQQTADMSGRLPIPGRVHYLKDILHSCKTVEEVRDYIEKYDHSYLREDVFIYTDASGKYLIVEPYLTSLGQEDHYVLANFCPSTITDFSSITQQRYRNGVAFLRNKRGASLDFCTALSDTMHVCRKKVGDGTMLTSIWDPLAVQLNLYFYHDYRHCVTFDLREELGKGDHSLEIAGLFPPNEEYRQLLAYKTPANSSLLRGFILFCFLLFGFSFLYFLVDYFRSRKARYAAMKILLSLLSLCMAYYMSVLARETAVFYFPAPYHSYRFGLSDIAAYLPWVLLLSIIPLLLLNRAVLRFRHWPRVSGWLLSLSNLSYVVLILLFVYWGMYGWGG